jgi:hypothetical protein
MKRYDVMAPRAKKDGGTFWVRVGTAFDGDKGIGIEFDCLPLPDKEGRVSVRLFEPRERTAAQSAPAAGYPSYSSRGGDLDDSVPF